MAENNNNNQPNKATADVAKKNASLLWGILILVIGGAIGLMCGFQGALQSHNDGTWIYWIIYLTVPSVIIGALLMGIGAIVARLNEIIKLLREKNN